MAMSRLPWGKARTSLYILARDCGKVCKEENKEKIRRTAETEWRGGDEQVHADRTAGKNPTSWTAHHTAFRSKGC